MAPEGKVVAEERLTSRLEAFSDLVFGFSLSLVATRLDVPARSEDVFDSTRWLAVIVTFALVCRFWLEHYRLFRHHFVVRSFDLVVNFIFLFAIAVLPYAVQTFLRFSGDFAPLALYLGDLSTVLVALCILRIRGLRLRRFHEEEETRLRDWRRTAIQLSGACIAFATLGFLLISGADYQSRIRTIGPYIALFIAVSMFVVRRGVRQLPRFLRAPGK